ncbi:MAG: Veg family protein [Firmicutes bacterium]|nr:Veg family protein [Bacillota bacterium]
MDKLVGQQVMIRANRGRKKVLEVEGVLEQTYPKIFVVKLEEDHLAKRLSYTYTDILTKTVEVQVNGRPIGQQLKANA